MIARVILCSLLISIVSADFTYSSQGTDWADDCTLTQQSPINLTGVSTTCDLKRVFNLRFSNSSVSTQIYNTGETLKANGTFSRLFASNVNGQLLSFQASQFHFHSPSEHMVDGKEYDAELHIVHTISSLSTDDVYDGHSYAVVGIFFQVDNSSNATANPFWEALKLTTIDQSLTLNMQTLLQDQIGSSPVYWDYEGSLTTPPCSQVVNWYVMANPLNITQTQLDQVGTRWAKNTTFANGNGNDRKIQALNNRTLVKIGCGAYSSYMISYSLIVFLLGMLAIKF